MRIICSSCGDAFATKNECRTHSASCEAFDSDEHGRFDSPRTASKVDGVNSQGALEILGTNITIEADEFWKNEHEGFTPWLAANPGPLELALDTYLHDIRTEVSAGRYCADIVAENSNEEVVVVENQIGKGDHAHLGKLLTYGAYFDAPHLVWIAESFSKSHIQAAIELTQQYGQTRIVPVTFDLMYVGEYYPVVTFDTIWE